MNAVSAGYKVLFVNAKDLVDRLYEKMKEGTLRETLDELNKIPLLLIGELSYVKMDRERETFLSGDPPTVRKELPHYYDQPANGQTGRTVYRKACRHGDP